MMIHLREDVLLGVGGCDIRRVAKSNKSVENGT